MSVTRRRDNWTNRRRIATHHLVAPLPIREVKAQEHTPLIDLVGQDRFLALAMRFGTPSRELGKAFLKPRTPEATFSSRGVLTPNRARR